MHRTIVITLAALLATTTIGLAVVGTQTGRDAVASVADAFSGGGAGADEALLEGGMAGDAHGDVGMERPVFPPAEGSVPTAEEARSLEQVSRIVIRSDEDFTPENGVRSGDGTLDDPYVISDLYVAGDLWIADTDACFVVRENYIRGQFTLNWNGQCVHAHHNHIQDLRVNENVERTGYATGGLLEMNEIVYVGQLRHYDGEFRHNVVGPFAASDIWDTVLETVPVPWVQDIRVANVDGFNQGLLHHNTFHGSVDLDLHGHHHGTGFFAPHSHYHGSDADRAADHDHDHTDRWTSVSFTDNLVVDPEGYGLRYEDRNHAGDDRTARSEDEMDLEEDHRHHTHITIARNTIEAAAMWIDVFNADDRNHHTRNPGTLEIVDNQVTLAERTDDDHLPWIEFQYRPTSGIHVQAVKEVEVTITGNTVTFVPAQDKDAVQELLEGVWDPYRSSAGIDIHHVRSANLTVAGNAIEGYHYGIRAAQMDGDTQWTVEENRFSDVGEELSYDESVANEPAT